MVRMMGVGDRSDATPEKALENEVRVREDAEEVQSATGDVTELDTGIDNALKAREELESVTATVEEAVADGDGISPRESASINARLERIASLLGTTASAQGVTFRRESFGGSYSRLAATRMRLESLKEFGQDIWKAILSGWNWLKDAVNSMILSVTKSAEGIVKRFEGLQARLDAMTGDLKEKDSKLKTGAKWFSVDNTTSEVTIRQIIDTVAGSQAYLSKLKDTSGRVVEDANKFLKEHYSFKQGKESDAAGAVLVADKGKWAKTLGGVYADVFSGVTPITPDKMGKKKAHNDAKGYGVWGGNKTFYFAAEDYSSNVNKYTKDDGKLGSDILGEDSKTSKNVVVGVLEFSDAYEKTADDYAFFTKEKLSELCKYGLEKAELLKNFSDYATNVDKIVDTQIAGIEEIKKAEVELAKNSTATGGTDKAAIAAAKEAKSMAAAILTKLGQSSKTVCTKLPGQFSGSLLALGDVINAGIANLKVEKK